VSDRARAGLVLVLGLLLGSAAVVGAWLVSAPGEEDGPISVSGDFCSRTIGDVAGRWGMSSRPQETVSGERDALTTCGAAGPAGTSRLTLTVLALGSDAARSRSDRATVALAFACREIAEPDETACTGPVRSADTTVGEASAFITSNGRAVVTLVMTSSPDRAAATSVDVFDLSQVLRRGTTLQRD
jgi:hypothetical protein